MLEWGLAKHDWPRPCPTSLVPLDPSLANGTGVTTGSVALESELVSWWKENLLEIFVNTSLEIKFGDTSVCEFRTAGCRELTELSDVAISQHRTFPSAYLWTRFLHTDISRNKAQDQSVNPGPGLSHLTEIRPRNEVTTSQKQAPIPH